MAEINCTERRAGATDIMAVVRQLEQMLAGDSDQTTAQYYAQHDAALASILDAAGPMPPRAAGALAALAEIVIGQVEIRGTYDLASFTPEACLSDRELAARRAEFAESVATGFGSSRNVTSSIN